MMLKILLLDKYPRRTFDSIIDLKSQFYLFEVKSVKKKKKCLMSFYKARKELAIVTYCYLMVKVNIFQLE